MTVYALHHPDGRWIYHLPAPGKDSGFAPSANITGVFADGQSMTKLHGDWWATDHEAGRLTATAQPRAKTTGYRLRDLNAESVRYPAVLTCEVWDERRNREGDTLWELYDPIDEAQEPLEHVYDEPILVLEGREPPAPDERQWIAELPHVLGSRPEYLHLFPGRIPNLRAHLHKAIEAMPHVRHCFDNYSGYTGLHVVVSVPFAQPETRWRSDTSRRTGKPLKSGRMVPVNVERRLNLPVPADVRADNYEAALRVWDEQAEFWESVVRDASVAACNACGGTGRIDHGSEEYSRK